MAMLAIFAIPAAALSPWTRIASPDVELFTEGRESSARAVLRRFETLREIFGESYSIDAAPPLRVFIFSSAGEFEKFRVRPLAAGFYTGDRDRDLIVLHDPSSLERTASHEYLHRVMRHASPLLPHWLDEGLAEFYSTISLSGNMVHVGGPIPAHLTLLARELWLSAQDLAAGSRAGSPIFYAESWALVHMLSASPYWRAGMPEYVKLVSQGRDPEPAFSAAFGKSMEEALSALRVYIQHPVELSVPAPPPGAPEKYQATRVSLDATLALADLASHTEHPELARSLYQQAARENPKFPAAIAGLASLALLENRKDDARRQYQQAISLGDRDPDTYFQLAELTNDNALLEQALSLDPKFAPAHFLLGVRMTDARNLTAAIGHLEKAVAIEPRRFSYWHALAYAQSRAGDRAGTAESARRAAILASTDPEKQMAAALTGLAFETPFVHEKKPAVTTPASWQNPKGDRRAEGVLTRVDCDSQPVRLFLETGSPPATIELKVENPSQVELRNAEGISTTLDCGKQSRPIAAEYFGATMAVTHIEFNGVIIKR